MIMGEQTKVLKERDAEIIRLRKVVRELRDRLLYADPRKIPLDRTAYDAETKRLCGE